VERAGNRSGREQPREQVTAWKQWREQVTERGGNSGETR